MAKHKKSKRQPRHRASWRGHLTFGLVSFPVQAINALNRQESDIHFHQLHATCHRRIHYAKVCPVHGQVSNDEIVSGYEYKKGKYVEIDPEELEALRTEKERALTIDAFVAADEIDPVYFDGRMYYLVPDGAAGEEPYRVIADAMDREQCWGVGQVVFSGKDQIVAVRPLEGVLHMAMLNYEQEIRRPPDVLAAHKAPRPESKKIHLAQTLIRNWYSDHFDFSAYEDRYRDQLQDLIDAKIHGREIVAPKEEKEPQVLNLMDALKRSVARHRPHRASRHHRKRRSA